MLTGDRLESLFVLALATGLRRAELLGLRWSDVDLPGRALFVRQTLQRTDHGLAFVPPKMHRSARPLPLPLSALAVRALEAQHVRQAKERLTAGRCGRISAWSSPAPSARLWSRGTSTGALSKHDEPAVRSSSPWSRRNVAKACRRSCRCGQSSPAAARSLPQPSTVYWARRGRCDRLGCTRTEINR
ncbi:tyrosine-type recombinase/integrase [Micromonospora sp. MED01]|uniref:tyrosine-type recombinase/integrase n=1 Tax=Micromonospora alfalfae TaxID=2911212 RepID=UPI001EE87D28|nr:tyrosine-type recombinase/integrase [Micromonospora alfalfae]MCG5463583.1 tyrosine-type recombinase/integrase [Micromonospora alfalfae]